MGEITLSRCPWCNGDAHIIHTQCLSNGYKGYYVHHNCKVMMGLIYTQSYSTPEEAAEAWNRRADNETD